MFVAVLSCITAALAVTIVVGQVSSDGATARQGKGVNMFGWNMMDSGKRSCVGLNGRRGVCMGQSECTEMNGKSVGKCFPFKSCCSVAQNSCGGYSGASTSYFQNPDKFQDVCVYKINIRRNICQIRIDFERFSLAQPTKINKESAYTCEHDEFTLFSNDNTKMNLPILCGENSGQHVYVPVNQQTSLDVKNRQQVTLKFRLTTRDDDYIDSEPFWKLKISQLECQISSTNWWKIKDIARQAWDWEVDERGSNTKSKSYSLAPNGCLQYFTEKKGSFESFNYNKGLGHYLGNMNYAVCFKRNQETCRIKYEPVKFQLASNQKLTGSTERDCDTILGDSDAKSTLAPKTTTTSTMVTPTKNSLITDDPSTDSPTMVDSSLTTTTLKPRSRSILKDVRKRILHANVSKVRGDYLLILDGIYSNRLSASKYCGRSVENFGEITVNTQGPLYVAFVSDDYSNPNEDVEKGFKIDYSLTTTGC